MARVVFSQVSVDPVGFLELFGSSPAGVTVVLMSTVLLALLLFDVLPNHSFTRDEVALLLSANVAGLTLPAELFDLHLLDLGSTALHVNAFGAGVPLAISLYFLARRRVDATAALTAVALTSYVAFEVAAFDPARGIVIDHFLLLPLLATLVALLVHGTFSDRTAPLAYFSGVAGVLVGGDLLHLYEVPRAGDVAAISFGGAGVVDAIFMAGVLAVTLDTAMSLYEEGEPADLRDSTLE